MPAPQSARLNIRLSSAQKKLIEQAANLLGQSVSAFTVSTAVREAAGVVERFGTVSLNDRDRDTFLKALDNPPKPNVRLKKAVKARKGWASAATDCHQAEEDTLDDWDAVTGEENSL